MNHLEILERHFNSRDRIDLAMGEILFEQFKEDYAELLKVILASMQEVENKANSNNLKQLK